MKPSPISAAMLVVSLFLAPTVLAQSPDSANQGAASSASAAEVPRLIKFSGTLLDAQDRLLAGPVGVTFALHAQQTGGTALWMETQNVTPDARGNYTVLLGANSANGVPAELFASGEARWLEVQVERQAEQPRILLVSVPYALKAVDAQTLGGMPASAFVMAAPSSTASGTSMSGSTTQASGNSKTALKAAASGKAAAPLAPTAAAVTTNFLPVFTNNAGALGNSLLVQSGNSMGLGQPAGANPTIQFDVNGGIRGTGLATGGRNVAADAINTNALFLNGSNAMGVIGTSNAAFAPGVLFKKTSFYSGGLERMTIDGTTGNVGIGTTTPGAKLEIAGGNLALPKTTSASVGAVTLGGTSFLHNFGTNNTFLGANAGNFTTSGNNNTAVGFGALQANIGGFGNTAVGSSALNQNMGFTSGSLNTAVGFGALQANTEGSLNTAVGYNALNQNTGEDNSAFGGHALEANTTGMLNSAFGVVALFTNTTGNSNSAFGDSALRNNTTGGFNSAFGDTALTNNATGNNNSAFGYFALEANGTGNNNAAFGFQALQQLSAGNNASNASNNSAFGSNALSSLVGGIGNIAIGSDAGSSLTPSGFSNIYIGNRGVGSESNTIRIGDPAVQTATFLAGINGATSASGVAVFVNPSGQLGTTTSSRRFKDEIANMAGESDLLMKLRPVAFYYKPELDDTHTRQYGLVAEEVAQVAPQLVVFDKDGVPQTVRYHFVNAMLLNEVQKQRQLVEDQRQTNEKQQSTIEQQQSTITRQQSEIQDLAARLAKLEALVAPAP